MKEILETASWALSKPIASWTISITWVGMSWKGIYEGVMMVWNFAIMAMSLCIGALTLYGLMKKHWIFFKQK